MRNLGKIHLNWVMEIHQDIVNVNHHRPLQHFIQHLVHERLMKTEALAWPYGITR